MATKKPSSSGSKPKPKPQSQSGQRLQNLAARPSYDDLTLDDQLVDHSGVFRVTNAISQAQTGHDEDSSRRFPNDSLAMAAQRDGFRDDGPTIDEAVEEHAVVDEASRAEKKQRLLTLAARNQVRNRTRR